MSDDQDFSFAAEAAQAPLLKNDSRDAEGSMLFAKLGKPITFQVVGWNPFTGDDGKAKPALQLRYEDGTQFLWPIGSTAKAAFRNAGANHPDDLVDAFVSIEAYETGSPEPFDIGKRVVDVELNSG